MYSRSVVNEGNYYSHSRTARGAALLYFIGSREGFYNDDKANKGWIYFLFVPFCVVYLVFCWVKMEGVLHHAILAGGMHLAITIIFIKIFHIHFCPLNFQVS